MSVLTTLPRIGEAGSDQVPALFKGAIQDAVDNVFAVMVVLGTAPPEAVGVAERVAKEKPARRRVLHVPEPALLGALLSEVQGGIACVDVSYSPAGAVSGRLLAGDAVVKFIVAQAFDIAESQGGGGPP